MNPVHFKTNTPPNSPLTYRTQEINPQYDDRADESESEESIKETEPINIPKKTEKKIEYVWNDIYFGD